MNSSFKQIRTQLGRRSRQFRELWKSEGPTGIIDRSRRAAAGWLAPKDAILPVRRADVLAADFSRSFEPPFPEQLPDHPLIVNWVTTPPSRGSGGHTTLFRIIRYLEANGYKNRVYFYDVYGGDHQYYVSIVRRLLWILRQHRQCGRRNGGRAHRSGHRMADGISCL